MAKRYRSESEEEHAARKARVRAVQKKAQKEADRENVRTTTREVAQDVITDAAIGAATGGVGLIGRAAVKGGAKLIKAGMKARKATKQGAGTHLRNMRRVQRKIPKELLDQVSGKRPKTNKYKKPSTAKQRADKAAIELKKKVNKKTVSRAPRSKEVRKTRKDYDREVANKEAVRRKEGMKGPSSKPYYDLGSDKKNLEYLNSPISRVVDAGLTKQKRASISNLLNASGKRRYENIMGRWRKRK